MRGPKLTKDQRDRVLMLRTVDNIMRADYARPWNHDRYTSVETHASAIYDTMDPSKWDDHFILAARKYLAEYRDPNLRLLVPRSCEQSTWGRGFSVRRDGDSLVVVETREEDRVHLGDRIVRLGGREVPAFRDQARFWLHAGDVERELWSLALDSVADITLDTGEKVELSRRAPEPVPTPPLEMDGGTVYAPMIGLHPVDIPLNARGLIVDVRRCSGNADAAGGLEALLPLLVDRPTRLADLLGGTWHVNCSANNADRKALALRALLKQATDDDEARQIETLAREVSACKDGGFRKESDAEDYGERFAKPFGDFPVVVLTDVGTVGDAELLAEVALASPRCAVVGRPTGGGVETGDLCVADLGDGYSLLYPTSCSDTAFRDRTLPAGAGIQPSVRVAWSPAHLTQDADLEAARDVLNGLRQGTFRTSREQSRQKG